MYAGMPDRSRMPLIGRRQTIRPPPEETLPGHRWQPQRRFPTGWTIAIAGTCAAIAVQILIYLDGQIDFRPLASRGAPHPAITLPIGTTAGIGGDPAPAQTMMVPATAIRISDSGHQAEGGGPAASPGEKVQCAAMVSAATTVRNRHSNSTGEAAAQRWSDRDEALRSFDRAKGAGPAQTGYMDRCRLLIGLILMGASGQALQSRVPGFLGPPLLPGYGSPPRTGRPAGWK